MNDPEQSMAAASLAGGLASAVVNRGADPTIRKVADGIGGALVGIFCAPGLSDLAGASNEHVRMALGFAVAACGAVLLTLLMDQAKGISMKEWLARFIGNKSP